MIVRKGNPADVQDCVQIDRSFTTAHVWQMDERIEGDEINVAFRPIRLPRPLTVPSGDGADWLSTYLPRADLFLVADERGLPVGYIALSAKPDAQCGEVRIVVVEPSSRQRGVGLALLTEAKSWARGQRLQTLIMEARTKNYPVIRLGRKAGFVFCGFNDRLYPGREIAVYFACSV